MTIEAELVSLFKEIDHGVKEHLVEMGGGFAERVRQEIASWPDEDRGYTGVSELWSMCTRKTFLEHVLGKKPRKWKTFKSRLSTDIGTKVHEMYQNWRYLRPWLVGYWECASTIGGVSSGAPLCANSHFGYHPGECSNCGQSCWQYQEIEFIDTKTGIQGHIDGIIVENGETFFLDIKTMQKRYFDALDGKPAEDNLYQVQNYLDLMQNYGDDIKAELAKMGLPVPTRGILLYICPNERDMLSFYFDYDKKFAVNGRKKHKANEALKAELAAGNLPAIPDRICDSPHCKRAFVTCQYDKDCFNDRVVAKWQNSTVGSK